jgi:hypothetical protein
LPVAEQRRLTQAQPVPGGGQLVVVWAPNEVTAKVLNSAGKTERSWRITSATGVLGTSVVPAYVNGDPIVPLTLYQPGTAETVVVRLTATGAQQPVVLSRVMVGATVNDIRVGPDRALYQMRVSSIGVVIDRYTLGFPAPVASPAPSTNPSAAAPTAAASVAPAGTPAATAERPQTPAAQTPADHTSWWPWLVTIGVILIAGVTSVVLVWWRRRRFVPQPTEVEEPVTAGTGPPVA